MSHKLMGKKKGMTQIFTQEGKVVPCTVIEFEPNIVVQVKTEEVDGYNALQLGTNKVVTKDPRTVAKRVNKPQLKHFEKANVEPRKDLFEVRFEQAPTAEVGSELGVEVFESISHVDVKAVSKGKGFQGVMKKYGFSGGPASHGSGFHRRAGSTGMRSTPGRCLPNSPRPSQMGNKVVSVQNLPIEKIIPEKRLMLVRGAVPGPIGRNVLVAKAIKR